MASEMIWYLVVVLLALSLSQKIERINNNGTGVCKGGLYTSTAKLKELEGCVVILGHLKIKLELGLGKGVTFRDLREITEYLVIYRANGLESLGTFFPNLTRIRGEKLLHNFALIVYDNANLREIGLYNLLKIDRGGVILWGLPQACFVDTINWGMIAPNARHVISSNDQTQCNILCRCTENTATDKCWNIKKCQIFTEGKDNITCHDQCLGCRGTKDNICFVCRHYTYQGNCVSKCPSNSIILPDNKYCITEAECLQLDQWVWNGTCISECPVNYKIAHKNGVTTCEPCEHCKETCGDLFIQSLSSIQNAERCVYVNGSLNIHMRAIPGALSDMKRYLSRIQEISNYISIENSNIISSLDFLPSLRLIKGKKLKEGKYSIDVRRNINLQALFLPNVIKNLEIRNGTARFDDNPVLCMNKVDEVKHKVPRPPDAFDIPEGSNGYRSGCKEINFDYQIRFTSDTSVIVMFSPVVEHDIHYAALYIRLPNGLQTNYMYETCSESEWNVADVPTIVGDNFGFVELSSLHPASTYALCIEIYDPEKKRLVKSNMVNFTTPVGSPEPPFIIELVASSSDVVVIRWVDHKDYADHINSYKLDVALIEIDSNKLAPIDHCKYDDEYVETDYTRHAFVRRPPNEYNRGCESMCGVLSTVTPGAMVEDYFDACDGMETTCKNDERFLTENSTIGNYVKTLVLNITGPRTNYQVGNLAPFSDYKFRLRACSKGNCSRSARGVVRTFRLKNADLATITSVSASSGNIDVEWTPPAINNGPVLTYTIEVVPQININTLMPQAWCVLANETRKVVKSVIATTYIVRVCVGTLASRKSCTDWSKVTNVESESKWYWLWRIALCGMIVYIAFVIRWWLKRRVPRSDLVPLVDSSSSTLVESDPPILSMSDSVPFYTIPLH